MHWKSHSNNGSDKTRNTNYLISIPNLKKIPNYVQKPKFGNLIMSGIQIEGKLIEYFK